MEKDDDAPEDMDLMALLLPEGRLDAGSSVRAQFGLNYNQALLMGWVKQSSPACAAASVAGAWNALHGWTRRDAHAVQQRDVVAILAEILRGRVSAKQERLERGLGASLDPLIAAVR